MRGKGVQKRPGSPSTAERLASIESTLREIQNYMDQSQVKMNHMDRLVRDVEEIKRNTKKSGFSLFGKRGKGESVKKKGGIGQISEVLNDPAVQSMLRRSGDRSSKGLNIAEMLSLLQNPAIQSLLEQNSQNKKKGKKKGKRSDNQFDWSEIMGLIQNPALLSMLNQMK